MSWPIVVVRGSAHERGVAYGTQAAERIRGSLALYRELVAQYGNSDWIDACARAESFVIPLRAHTPHLLEEMEGIAEGAGVGRGDILALNCRNELMFAAGAPMVAECTSVAVAGALTRSGTPLVAQNWDWKPSCLDTAVLLVAHPSDAPAFMTVVEAGHLAKIGLNDAGVALATNTLVSVEDGEPRGLPYHALLRLVLEQSSLAAAIDVVAATPRATSGNFLVASEEEVANIEAGSSASGKLELYLPYDGYLAHTNHFRGDEVAAGTIGPMESVANSRLREFRVETALRRTIDHKKALSAADLTAVLADHVGAPDSICCHPNEKHHPARQYVTISSVVLDSANRRLSATVGPPCAARYEVYEWP